VAASATSLHYRANGPGFFSPGHRPGFRGYLEDNAAWKAALTAVRISPQPDSAALQAATGQEAMAQSQGDALGWRRTARWASGLIVHSRAAT